MTTFSVGNLVLLTAARPATVPFLATMCFTVQAEVTSLGSVCTQTVSIIKFGSFGLGTLPGQFHMHRVKKASFYRMHTGLYNKVCFLYLFY